MLNAEQLQRFSLQGYLIFESLITGRRLDWYVSVLDELVERGRELREPVPHFSLELNCDGSPRPGLLHKVQGVCVVEPRILELAREPAIDVEVPGGSVVLFCANLLHGTADNDDPERTRYATAWHYVPGDIDLERFPRDGYDDRFTVHSG